MGDEENELFCEQFSIYPGKAKFKVTLTGKRVLVNQADSSGRERSEDIILLDDVTGCYVLEDKRKNSLAAYLSIYSYPLKKKKFGSSVVRQRIERTFTIECKKTYQENSMLAEKWKMTIKRLVAGEKIRTVEDIENGALAVRNLLVLINPFSGRKRAETLYKEKVKPMFIEAEIKHTVKKTEYPGHAREMAKLVKLEDWDGIVIVSGDGLVHEVINGLMDRPDWKEAIKMPIGIVPGGSGNALAAALVYASTGQMLSSNLDLDSVFEIVRGKTRKMSLAAIEMEGGQKYYSFLNFAWGFIADVDIESERYRKLGPVRFAIGCAIRVANMRLYEGRISYLPATKSAFSFGRSQSVHENFASGDSFDSPLTRGRSTGALFNPKRAFGRSSRRSKNEDAIHTDVDLVRATLPSQSEDNVFENGIEDETREEPMSLTPVVNGEDQQHEVNDNHEDTLKNSRTQSVDSNHSEPGQSSPSCNGVADDQDSASQVSSPELEDSHPAPSTPVRPVETPNDVPIGWKDSAIVYHLRSSLDSPPPDDWVQIQGEYIWVTSVYLSHLGNEMSGIPSAKLDEDIIYIYTLKRGISKTQMINVLLGFEGGTQIERGGDFSSVIPCQAVRLEPLNFITGHMTVDGEPVPHCSIQASVTPHKLNLMSSSTD